MDSADASDQMISLPNEIRQSLLRYLSAEDLCRMALCKRSWREMANQNDVWRPLCWQRGWERYGTVSDLCKEPPFVQGPDSKGFKEGVRFIFDSVITGSSEALVATAHWKEVYMKARHLEENWSKNRYHLVEFEFGSAGSKEYWGNNPELHGPGVDNQGRGDLVVMNLAGEGNCLAGGILNHPLQLWDASTGECRHVISAAVADSKESLKVKNGIVVAGCTNGSICTFSSQTGEPLKVMSGHGRPISRLFFDGDIIVSIAQPPTFDEDIPDIGDDIDDAEDEDFADWLPSDSIIRVWSAAEGTSLCVLTYRAEETHLINLDYRDKVVAGAYRDQTICVWDACTGSLKHTLKTEIPRLMSCHLGNGFIIGTNDGNDPVMKTWDLKSGKLLESFDIPDAELYDDDTFQVNRRPGYVFNGDVLLVRSAWGVLASISLDGKYLSDTKPPPSKRNDMLKLILTCLQGNKIVAADYCDGKMFLWKLSRDGRLTLIKKLRDVMNDELDSGEFSVACLTDTKLAFVHYFEDREEIQDQMQMPKIVIHHYW